LNNGGNIAFKIGAEWGFHLSFYFHALLYGCAPSIRDNDVMHNWN
jgi:hypothetical protein